MLLGIIEEGKLKGRKIILKGNEKKIDKNKSIWLVEKGKFINGDILWSKACLIHEEFIDDNGCPKCKKENERKRIICQQIY